MTGTAENATPVAMPGSAARGAVAGLVGGLVYGGALWQLGLLPTVAGMVGVRTEGAGLLIHLTVAVILGAGFGVLLRNRAGARGETLFWGMTYGIVWWYLGMLTLFPLLAHAPFGWNIDAAEAAFPFLVGHLVYGLCTAFILVMPTAGTEMLRRSAVALVVRRLVVGVASGLIATLVLMATLGPAFSALAAGTGWLLLLGAVAGGGYTLLFPGEATTGPSIARGAGYGLLVWIVVPLTAVPFVHDGHLPWTTGQVRALFPLLPAAVLLGSMVGALSSWLTGMGRLLLEDPADRADDESLGARTSRAVVRGAIGGVAGGLVFTVIMLQIGYLGTVARLVGSTSLAVGLTVHLAISVLLGSSYGLCFRRQSDDLTSAIGWGMSWGFLWWILGALTILPTWLGGAPQWSAAGAAAAFLSLIGHLGYGAALGVTFHALEARHDPWWMRGRVRTSAQVRALRQRARQASSAPAVWVLNALMAVTITVLLGR